MRITLPALMIGLTLGFSILWTPARAEFVISSAIVEFASDTSPQQDIELASRSKETDYIVTEISEILHPGMPNESRVLIEDPEESRLLVTPGRTILTGGGRRVLRFMLLKDLDDQEHIYRVAVKPVIKGTDNKTKLGLKILVGYEVLVILRPSTIKPSYEARREGTNFTVTNNGNTNILFESGMQCPAEEECAIPSVIRAYPGQKISITLPQNKAVDYMLWDGDSTAERHFD